MSGNELNVSVKALMWNASNEGYGHGRSYYGTGVFGHWYCVSRAKNRVWACVHHIGGRPEHLPYAHSLDEAKSAAQADYEARILSALSPQSVEVEPIGYCLWLSPTKLAGCAKSAKGSFAVYASPQPVTKPAMGEGWMPIETAPRDGKRILGYDHKVWEDEQISTTYCTKTGEWVHECMIESRGYDDYRHERWKPTHWMPLPAPPATGGEEL